MMKLSLVAPKPVGLLGATTTRHDQTRENRQTVSGGLLVSPSKPDRPRVS